MDAISDRSSTANNGLDEVPPPPWWLTGEGYIFPVRCSRDVALQQAFIPPSEHGAYVGGWGAWMVVRYRESPVGPYDELLYIPGCSRRGLRFSWQISKIYVSTRASVHAGRRNWGIPKELASFDFTRDERGLRVEVRDGQGAFFQVSLRTVGPTFPIVSLGTPPNLLQPVREHADTDALPPIRQGEWLSLPALGRGWGWSRLVRLGDVQIDPTRFPDVIACGSLRTGVACLPFHMKFPVPRRLS